MTLPCPTRRSSDVIKYLGCQDLEHRVVTLPRQLGIGARTGIFDRAPDDDAAWPFVERAARVRDQALEEQAAHILEPKRLAPDHRPLEQWARRDALERLDEAAVERRLQIFLDRRSEERRVGKGGVSTCCSRWSPYH